MTVNDLINELQMLKKELKDKEVVVQAPNGVLFEPKIKFRHKDPSTFLNNSAENVESVVLHWD